MSTISRPAAIHPITSRTRQTRFSGEYSGQPTGRTNETLSTYSPVKSATHLAETPRSHRLARNFIAMADAAQGSLLRRSSCNFRERRNRIFAASSLRFIFARTWRGER